MVDFQERDTRRGMGDRSDRIDRFDEEDETASTGSGAESTGEPDHGDHGHDEPAGHEHDDHDHHAHDVDQLGVAVLTVSSSRSLDDDPAGDAIAAALEADEHAVASRDLVPDDFDRIQDVVDALVARSDVDVVVTTGGTGVTPDDVTVEAIAPLVEKSLPGFGELFRRRSEAEIGTRVVATRAFAGVADGVPVFCLPGSEAAVRLATEEIILPEAGHLAGLAGRGEAGAG